MIRLFVGADADNCDLESQAVLEYSIRRHCSMPLSITWMQSGRGPWAGWKTSSARTPFSHFRWSIPAVCDWRGRAIYMDSDFIIRGDLAELWNEPIPERVAFLAKNPEGKVRTCCMLFDCATARDHLMRVDMLREQSDPQGRFLKYFKSRVHLMAPFTTGDWNCIDLQGYDDLNDPRIKAIHYSRIEHQLHLKHALPRLKAEGREHWYTGPLGAHPRPELQALFDQLLEEAIAAGYPPERYRITSSGPVERRDFVYKRSQVTT